MKRAEPGDKYADFLRSKVRLAETWGLFVQRPSLFDFEAHEAEACLTA